MCLRLRMTRVMQVSCGLACLVSLGCASVSEHVVPVCRHKAMMCGLAFADKYGPTKVGISLGTSYEGDWHAQAFVYLDDSSKQYIKYDGETCIISKSEMLFVRRDLSIKDFAKDQFYGVFSEQ